MFKFIRNLFANKNKEEFNSDLSTITKKLMMMEHLI